MNKDKMGLFLLELRQERNLLQTDIASIFNVTPQAVSKWERGESIPDIDILEKIASFYNISIEEILNGERKNKQQKDKNNIKPNYNSSFIGIIVFTILFLLIGLLPFYNFSGTSASLLDLIFLSTYKLGNFILLSGISLLLFHLIVKIIIIFSKSPNKYLLYIKDYLLFISIGILISFCFIPFNSHGILNSIEGAILLGVISVSYLIYEIIAINIQFKTNSLLMPLKIHYSILFKLTLLSLILSSTCLVESYSYTLIYILILWFVVFLFSFTISLIKKNIPIFVIEIVLISLFIVFNITFLFISSNLSHLIILFFFSVITLITTIINKN